VTGLTLAVGDEDGHDWCRMAAMKGRNEVLLHGVQPAPDQRGAVRLMAGKYLVDMTSVAMQP